MRHRSGAAAGRRISGEGPRSTRLAATRSVFRAEMMRLSTAALMVGIGAPTSRAFWLVHLPVPFCAASSRMRSSTAPPLSGSRCVKMAAVISIRYERSSPVFHSENTSCSSSFERPSAAVQHVVGLGDQLHVAVLDAVVHHLHVVPGAERTHVLHARHAIVGLRGHGQQDGRQRVVGLTLAAGHHARPPQRALLAAGHAHADEVKAVGLRAPCCAVRCRGTRSCRRRSGCRRARDAA